MRRLHRALDRLALGVEALLAGLFLTLFLVTMLNIVLRNVAGVAWMWIPGFTRLTFIWLVFLGAAVVARRGEHLVVDLLQQRLPKRARRVAVIAIHTTLLPFYWVMLRFGWEVSQVRMRVPFDTWALPTGYAYLAVPVAAALLLVFTIERLVITLRE